MIENPEDDAPRQIYADWLDEHGDPVRAEFIRVQCELARWRTFDDDELGSLVRPDGTKCPPDDPAFLHLSLRERQLFANNWHSWSKDAIEEQVPNPTSTGLCHGARKLFRGLTAAPQQQFWAWVLDDQEDAAPGHGCAVSCHHPIFEYEPSIVALRFARGFIDCVSFCNQTSFGVVSRCLLGHPVSRVFLGEPEAAALPQVLAAGLLSRIDFLYVHSSSYSTIQRITAHQSLVGIRRLHLFTGFLVNLTDAAIELCHDSPVVMKATEFELSIGTPGLTAAQAQRMLTIPALDHLSVFRLVVNRPSEEATSILIHRFGEPLRVFEATFVFESKMASCRLVVEPA